MTLKINSTTVIDDSFNLTNIINASISGNVSIVDDSNSPSLTVTQNGTGAALVVEDELSDSTPFIVTNDGKVGIGTTNFPATSSLAIGNLLGPEFECSIGFKTTGTRINNIYGHRIGLELGSLVIRNITDPEFTTSYQDTSILRIDGSNPPRIGIKTESPQFTLDVRGQARITGNVGNGGIRITPNRIQQGVHAIESLSNTDNLNRALGYSGSEISVLVGSGLTATTSMTVNSVGNANFSAMVATNGRFFGRGADWHILQRTILNNTEVNVNFIFGDGEFTHYAFILRDVNFDTPAAPIFRLIDSTPAVQGVGTYFTTGLFLTGASNDFGSFQISNSSAWFVNGSFIDRTNSDSGISARIILYNPVRRDGQDIASPAERRRRVTIESQFESIVDTVLHRHNFVGGGSVDIPDATPAYGVNFGANTGATLFSGVIEVYGIS